MSFSSEIKKELSNLNNLNNKEQVKAEINRLYAWKQLFRKWYKL